MKKLIISVILLSCIIGCEEDKEEEKFFNPDNLGLCSLENIDGFWNKNEVTDTSSSVGAMFELHSGYLKGIHVFSKEKFITVSVFNSQSAAINAMELRINNVAAVIRTGTSGEIKVKWWFSGYSTPPAVFVNQWNTIIEVVIFEANYEEVKTLLIETATEIARRIDSLSN